MYKTRILIADRRPRIRFALRALLKRQPGIELVGEAGDAQDLETQIETARPDALLLDWWLKGMATDDLLAELKERCPSLRVIVLSGRPEARRAALCAGADAFVSKVDPPDRLLAAVGSVRRGDVERAVLTPSYRGA
jgi:DNA-binding NarL/FixJ family response regulator